MTGSEAMTRDERGIAASPAAAAPLIEVEDLEVAYHVYGSVPNRALRGISFQIMPGQILGLVGESGVGKSTLARAIMRVLPSPGRIERGQVRFMGSDLVALDEAELAKVRGRNLAMIVANPRGELNPLLPIGRQIAEVAHAHLAVSREEAARLAIDMLKAVSIPDPERRMRAFPHELSGGMAQRVVIAIALVCSPKFVISDDATSGLDVTVQAQILNLLRRLAREKHMAMLYITRDIGVAANFCDQIAIIYRGQIVEEAPTDAFFGGPEHPYSNLLLAAFVHDPRLRARWGAALARVTPAAGEVGCLFADHCVNRQERCVRERPALEESTPGRLVRCHFPVHR